MPRPNSHTRALEIDRELTDPVLRERMRAGAKTWRDDQMDAAAADVRRLLDRACDIGLMANVDDQIQFFEHPEWVRLGALDGLLTWTAGKSRSCIHDPNARRPEPVFAAAWKPHLVVCQGCTPILRVAHRSDANFACDCCGQVTGRGGANG